jgi:hypothetical protein
LVYQHIQAIQGIISNLPTVGLGGVALPSAKTQWKKLHQKLSDSFPTSEEWEILEEVICVLEVCFDQCCFANYVL